MKVKKILPVLTSSHIIIMRYREFFDDYMVMAVEESYDHCFKRLYRRNMGRRRSCKDYSWFWN